MNNFRSAQSGTKEYRFDKHKHYVSSRIPISYCQESINISTVPIYNLDPNTRVHVKDPISNINGEYIISKISIPLNYKKMMSITATKAISDII